MAGTELTAANVLLEGLRVLDLSDNLAGLYACRLFADAGAEVSRFDGLSPWLGSPGTGESEEAVEDLVALLTDGHRVVTEGDLGRLLAEVDVVVESDACVRFDRAAARSRRPELVVLTFTDFGLDGPLGGMRASSAIRQAISGSTYWRGVPSEPPVMAAGEVEQYLAAAHGAAFGLAAVLRSRDTGCGDHLDVSLTEAANLGLTTFGATHASLWGRLGEQFPTRSVQVPAIEHASDGWVGLCAISARQRQDLMLILGRADLAEDETIAYSGAESANAEAMRIAIGEWAATKTVDEVTDLASAIRVPVAPIGTGETIVSNEQLIHRGFISETTDGLRIGAPFRFRRSERAGGRSHRSDSSPDRPLAGLRVVDLTAWWAGPAGTQVYAYLGADVVKVESGHRPDGMRFSFVDDPSRPRWWEFGPVFFGVNTNKRGVSIDFGTPRGRELLTELLLRADMLVESFTPRVLEALDLDWARIAEENPGLVTVRMSAFGHDGPWRDRTGFAQTVEQASGLAWVTGHEDGPPVAPRGVCDPLAGMHAAYAGLAALAHRERTGRGGVVELSMLETAVRATVGQVLAHRRTGRAPGRAGNRDAVMCPQNVYPALGNDAWVAVSVRMPEEWFALAKHLGMPSWQEDAWAEPSYRHARRAEIDGVLAEWVVSRSATDAAAELSDAGVPAVEVLGAGRVPEHAQFRSRGFFESVVHPIAGAHIVPAPPLRSAERTSPWVMSPAPVLGEHTDDVLRDWLGLDDAVLHALRESGVTDDEPRSLMGELS